MRTEQKIYSRNSSFSACAGFKKVSLSAKYQSGKQGGHAYGVESHVEPARAVLTEEITYMKFCRRCSEEKIYTVINSDSEMEDPDALILDSEDEELYS